MEGKNKIVGTFTVNDLGQIEGLEPYKGKEILVILLGEQGGTAVPTLEDLVDELQQAVIEHMEMAFTRYNKLKDSFPSPLAAAQDFAKQVMPKQAESILGQLDKWVEKFKP